MSNSTSAHETIIQFPKSRAVGGDRYEQFDATTAELQAIFAREKALREEIGDLLRRQATLTQEFERRLANGLELIASLLSLQSQTATTPEATAQLSCAARCIAVMEPLRCRLNLLEGAESTDT
jgi:ABC-type transporter Mla subunit MlaD